MRITVRAQSLSIPCTRKVDSAEVHGMACQDNGELYHHTSFDNFESIMNDKVLKPGMGPLDDGTVNYTGNPNFHRFGAIRLVFDSSIKDRLIPMCYVRGEDMAILSNAVSRREHESNFEIPSNRIQNREFAAEPWLYKDECKWLSKDEMSLNGLKRIEYWIPWSPIRPNSPAGSSVSPCYPDYTAWQTGISSQQNVRSMMAQIIKAAAAAERLNVPFEVKSCYRFIAVDGGYIPLDESNLAKMSRGMMPKVITASRLPEERSCLCSSEEIKQ